MRGNRDGDVDADRARELPRPLPARQQHLLRRDVIAADRLHTGELERAVGELVGTELRHAAVLHEADTGLARQPHDVHASVRRVDDAVRRRVQRPEDALRLQLEQRVERLRGREGLLGARPVERVRHVVLLEQCSGALELRPHRRAPRQPEAAGLGEPDVREPLLVDGLGVKVAAPLDHRDQGLVALDIPEQPCRVPRRAGGERVLLEHDDAPARPGQLQRRGGADDAAAHHDRVHGLRHG